MDFHLAMLAHQLQEMGHGDEVFSHTAEGAKITE